MEQTTTKMTMSRHPKGHKVRSLEEVWTMMDSQDFLHLTDTLALSDVWVQPVGIDMSSSRGTICNVYLKEIVAAPHFKTRESICKLSIDDLLKILYLNESIQCDMENVARVSFEEWITLKTDSYRKNKGVDEMCAVADDELANYIINEDPDFSFYPSFLHGRCGVFFRKISYHSYKTKEYDAKNKFVNPSMLKCRAKRGNFEYILEARVFPLPVGWFDTVFSTSTTGEEK